ncbi:V-set and transmembrane domain-containing protein 4 [Acipenser ruthenus]|uniref:V-set and transmembrane domain-containing protein 4 n=1 Tax=Acipenser ruthenus TaxID=7906 RepID=A0A662YYC5_ACIRT|nr:V-set and transmembrane domain-containing protein 4 [Acipenser ruthenus]
MFMEGENVTLSCHVSQQKNSNSILVVRWMFSLVPDEEHLLVKMNMRKPKIAEESLTYAELELVKPQPENKSVCTGTVYAQILFEEKQL